MRRFVYSLGHMKKSLFDGIPDGAPEELFTDLLSSESVRIERIVSFGQRSADTTASWCCCSSAAPRLARRTPTELRRCTWPLREGTET